MSSEDHPTAVPCPKCGYELLYAAEPRCPECGQTFSSFQALGNAAVWSQDRAGRLLAERERAAQWLAIWFLVMMVVMTISRCLPATAAYFADIPLFALPICSMYALYVLVRTLAALRDPRISPEGRGDLRRGLPVLLLYCAPCALIVFVALVRLLWTVGGMTPPVTPLAP